MVVYAAWSLSPALHMSFFGYLWGGVVLCQESYSIYWRLMCIYLLYVFPVLSLFLFVFMISNILYRTYIYVHIIFCNFTRACTQ